MSDWIKDERLDQQILGVISKYWWVLLLRGLAAVVFGIVAISLPGLTVFMLVVTFGIYTIFDGLLEIWNGFTNRGQHDRWWVDILIGLTGVVAGILIMSWPDKTAMVAIYLIAAWMVVTGVLQVITAIRVRKDISNEWFLILSGALSVVVGAYFFAFPGSGAVSLVWVIGIYAMLFGILLVVMAFKARKGFA